MAEIKNIYNYIRKIASIIWNGRQQKGKLEKRCYDSKDDCENCPLKIDFGYRKKD